MNENALRIALDTWDRSIPHKKQGEYYRQMSYIQSLAEPEHIPTTHEKVFLSDYITCSCSWESSHYYDGMDIAWRKWREHLKEVV